MARLIEKVEHLVHRRVDVGIRDQLDGWTPLHLACNLHHHQNAEEVADIVAAVGRAGSTTGCWTWWNG